jgi:hypothetical protein
MRALSNLSFVYRAFDDFPFNVQHEGDSDLDGEAALQNEELVAATELDEALALYFHADLSDSGFPGGKLHRSGSDKYDAHAQGFCASFGFMGNPIPAKMAQWPSRG